MGHEFHKIEEKWRTYFQENSVYKTNPSSDRPKYYILGMFPYPSGAGLHVGHPLGYIALDIFARYQRLKGLNVLNPMGYDSFGLPAEQYAIQTGQHPEITTEKNITRYRQQLEMLGLSFDWSREIRTSDPQYYKWTQWMFTELFTHWYSDEKKKALPISELIQEFEKEGNKLVSSNHNCDKSFSAEKWKAFSEKEQQEVLLCYRLAYLAEANVNWCPSLGTVLANDEVKDGLSVRGGHEVEQKKMKQWLLRVSAYSQRLLDGLEGLDWSDSIKEIQKNWIGRSDGASMFFSIDQSQERVEVFTTRPDTIYGVSFMVLAPESDYVAKLTTEDQREVVESYLRKCKGKTERERMVDTAKTGVFTGSYCINPFTQDKIPVWISDYVLGGYGTGAIMAVPAHDQRDYDFAKMFELPIVSVLSGGDILKEPYESKTGKIINSDFLNGMSVKEAIKKITRELDIQKRGKKQTNYRLRDAIFSRQRYWGEPIPIYYKDGMPYPLSFDELPLILPEVDKFLPTKEGHPPLGRAANWTNADGYPLELTTMPGFAGSSAYYLRYMDPLNENELVSQESNAYWKNVDFYIGGAEHATGHLIYSRFFNKFLFDLGKVGKDEPFQKMFNNGMIQGRSSFVYREKGSNRFISLGLKKNYKTTAIHIDVNMVENDILDLEAFKKWRPEFSNAEFELEEGEYHCGSSVEKMSKSLFNVVNPDVIVKKYGADTFRLYEMFLGPIEQSKPWNTAGIEGVSRFLKKLWNTCYDDDNALKLLKSSPSKEELKVIHTAIKAVSEAIESFSLNIGVSSLMICLNDLGKLKTNSKEIYHIFIRLLSPYAPYLCQEIWSALGEESLILEAEFPTLEKKYLVETSFRYPVSVNGKLKFLKELELSLTKVEIEKEVLKDAQIEHALGGKKIKKVIVVPNKIVNIVV